MVSVSIKHDTCVSDLFHETDQQLEEYNLTRDDVCVVGSTCLAVRGIRTHGDIDLTIDPEIERSTPLGGGRYNVLGITDTELFDDETLTDTVDSWKIVRPEIEYCYKQQRRRDKDKRDVELITEYKRTSDEWNHELESKYTLSRTTILKKNLWRSLKQDGPLTTLRRVARFVTSG